MLEQRCSSFDRFEKIHELVLLFQEPTTKFCMLNYKQAIQKRTEIFLSLLLSVSI